MSTQQTRMIAETAGARWLRYAGYGIACLALAFLLLYRLETFAVLRHDEGSFLHVAKNYALDGVYADSSSEGYRFAGPVISTGPTVILPIALLFRLVEVSVPLARLVIVVYGVLMLVALYGLAAQLGDRRLALVTLILAVTSTGLDFTYYSRHVLGEIPGLFFLFAGLWLWLRPGSRGLAALVGVGILMGLAAITKNQYAVFVLPGLLLAWILDLVWYRRRGWRYFVVPGLIAGALFFAWTYYVFFLLGTDVRNPADDMEVLRAAGSSGFVVLNPKIITENAYLLTGDKTYSGLFIPALLYGLFLSLRRDDAGQRWGTLTLFLALSAGLFIISVGWTRYAVPPIAFSALLVASLLHRLTDGYRPDWKGLQAALLGQQDLSLALVVQLVVLGLLVGMVVLPLGRAFFNVTAGGDLSPYQVAQYLAANAPPEALIETWETELAVLTDHRYHYPPYLAEQAVNTAHDASASPQDAYDFRDHVDPDYLILGPYSKWSGVYTADALYGYELVQSYGDYDIYRRRR